MWYTKKGRSLPIKKLTICKPLSLPPRKGSTASGPRCRAISASFAAGCLCGGITGTGRHDRSLCPPSAENHMTQPTNLDQLIAVTGDSSSVLGKIVYFSLADVMIDREKLREICDTMGIPYYGGGRQTDANAFRRATSDISDRIKAEGHIYKVYCRDNEKNDDLLSWELVKETVDASTNRYAKLANIQYVSRTGQLLLASPEYDPLVSPYQYFREAEALFEKYRRCAGRKHIETLTGNLMDAMQAVKINIHGRLYFVPRSHMEQVTLFEDFVELLNQHNLSKGELTVNSMPVMDSEKQRKKMATEFYLAVRKEIALYQEKVENLITSNSRSAAIMYRWVNKIDALERKKQEYESILRQDLDQLNDEFMTLQMFSQELSRRARQCEVEKAA